MGTVQGASVTVPSKTNMALATWGKADWQSRKGTDMKQFYDKYYEGG